MGSLQYPILGQDFLASNSLVENNTGRLLTKAKSSLFIPAIGLEAGHVNCVTVDQRIKALHKKFPVGENL